MEFLEILKIVLLGIVEGITEWLPVSSTGHLIILHTYLPVQGVSEHFMDMFEYVIQLAAIMAVVILFWTKIFPLGVKAKDGTDKKSLYWKTETLTLWWKVALACVPALAAFFIDQLLLDGLSEYAETIIIAGALIVYGVIFIVIETLNKGKNAKVETVAELSYKTAFLIGCFQILACIPGTSRSGITIIGALLLSVARPAGAEFTFLLAIPTMVGASGYKILKFIIEGATLSGAEWGYLIIGCVVAFGVSLAAIKFLMNFVKKHDFKIFGWYRIALGAVVIATLILPPLFA